MKKLKLPMLFNSDMCLISLTNPQHNLGGWGGMCQGGGTNCVHTVYKEY